MGFGDELVASGLARGAAARGKRVAFGDGHRIVWSAQASEIFRGNPNIAKPGGEGSDDLVWVAHYRGQRLYGDCRSGRWVFRDFDCPPGEIFLTQEERAFALGRAWLSPSDPIAIIEPRVKSFGACAGANKQWPVERYEEVARRLPGFGLRPVQFVPPYGKPLLKNAEAIETPSFRHALALLGLAALYIGPEGGLHHGAAAVGTPAVVIFGGFNTPRSTGYSWHDNITVGEPCGRIEACSHCRSAMQSIGVERVLAGVARQIRREAA